MVFLYRQKWVAKLKKSSMLIISLITLAPALSFAQVTIDVLEKGFDDGVKTTRQQDYMEAVMDAKLKAIQKAGVEIRVITEVENFQLKYDLVESTAEGVLLPGFRIEDIGYLADGTYQVVLSGKVKVIEKEKPQPKVEAEPPEKGTGALVITSTPSGAKVYIDGKEKDTRTPFQDLNVPAGEHEIRLTLEGYADYTKRVRVRADVITREDAALVRATVNVIVSSDPLEATVYFDGRPAGQTPITIPNVVAGRHTVRLSKEGYADHQEPIEVGNETVRFSKKLERPPTLDVSSLPPGASVYLDGKLLGTTPLKTNKVTSGTRTLRVELEKHDVWIDTVILENEKIATVKAGLTKQLGTLSIESDPAGARIYLDRVALGETPFTTSGLPVGKYEVEIRKENYYPWKDTATVVKDKTTEVVATLSGIPGSISVASTPSGAKVYLNDSYQGLTPLSISSLRAGRYRLRVSMDRYGDYQGEVAVNWNATATVNAVLPPEIGSISVASNPAGAEVYLDGRHLGSTPLKLDNLLVGVYDLKLSRSAYRDWQDSVRVEKGKTASVQVSLPPRAGAIKIISSEDGARVFIDGTDRGPAPLTVNELPVGRYRVRLTKERYRDYEATINVEDNRISELSAYLARKVGMLSVNSRTSSVEVFIDGERNGWVPLRLTLDEEDYLIVARKWGRDEYRERVSIRDRETTAVTVELKESSWKITTEWGSLVGGVALSMAAYLIRQQGDAAMQSYRSAISQADIDRYRDQVSQFDAFYYISLGAAGTLLSVSVVLFMF